jgi:hypothetical protein
MALAAVVAANVRVRDSVRFELALVCAIRTRGAPP